MTVLASGYKGLPVYRGLPVPWVTRWSGEARRDYTYHPEPVHDADWKWPVVVFNEIKSRRDADGVLWMPENSGHVGVPEFSMVSTRRQRASMKHRRCQICGVKILTEKTLIVLPFGDWNGSTEVKGEPFQCRTPPVCADCADFAPTICPALGRLGHRLVEVSEYRQWGVYGEYVKFVLNDDEIQMLRGQDSVPYGSPQIRAMMAKQAVIEVVKYEVL